MDMILEFLGIKPFNAMEFSIFLTIVAISMIASIAVVAVLSQSEVVAFPADMTPYFDQIVVPPSPISTPTIKAVP